jgi:hypothetical protein
MQSKEEDIQERSWWSLVVFDFDDKVGEFFGVVEEQLMGRVGGDANDIAWGQFLANAALDSAVALIVRRGGFGADECASYEQSRCT